MNKYQKVQTFFFLGSLVLLVIKLPIANAKCVCECENNKLKIVCEDVSDIKPVCMPLKCNRNLIGEIKQIIAPVSETEKEMTCKNTEKLDPTNSSIVQKRECK